MKKYFISPTIIFLIFFSCFSPLIAQAQTSPQLEDKTMIRQGIEILKNTLKEVLVIWKKAHQVASKWWGENILPKIKKWFEEKKPIIEKEFKEERKELTKELGKTFSNSWNWFKNLLK